MTMLQIRPYSRRALGVYLLLATVSLSAYLLRSQQPRIKIDDGKWVITSSSRRPERPKLHIFLPYSNVDVNLCKTLLSATVLGYPTPDLLSGNETFESRHNLTEAPRTAKIFHVLEHLQRMGPGSEKDLVMVMESTNIWFQLKPETLIDRYFTIRAGAEKRLVDKMGGAAYAEDIKQKIFFAAGKRCTMEDTQLAACSAVPESPLRVDTYGNNTDSRKGRTEYSSFRQRHLDSGFIIGPVAEMTLMFRGAAQKAQEWPTPDPDSQSIFSTMFGEQVSQRDSIRQSHETIFDTQHTKTPVRKALSGSKRSTAVIARVPADKSLKPSPRSSMELRPGVSYQFGMDLDYFSDLGHGTADADFDGRRVEYSELPESIKAQANSGRGNLDCKYGGNGTLSQDILRSPMPFPQEAGPGVFMNSAWNHLPLYTNLCTGRVPVMVQHNGNKTALETDWPQLWLQRHARNLLQVKLNAENDREEGAEKGIKESLEGPLEANSPDYATRLGAFTDSGAFKSWDQLCPSEYSAELFRDRD